MKLLHKLNVIFEIEDSPTGPIPTTWNLINVLNEGNFKVLETIEGPELTLHIKGTYDDK